MTLMNALDIFKSKQMTEHRRDSRVLQHSNFCYKYSCLNISRSVLHFMRFCSGKFYSL